MAQLPVGEVAGAAGVPTPAAAEAPPPPLESVKLGGSDLPAVATLGAVAAAEAKSAAAAARPMPPVAPADLAALREWRDEVLAGGTAPGVTTAEAREFLGDDVTLARYAVARGGDLAATKAALLASVAWRNKVIRRPMSCDACVATSGRAHCFIPLGLDAHQRPVIYASQPRALDTPPEVQMHHVVHTVEHALTTPGAHYQWVWVVDFNGFGFSHAMAVRAATSVMSAFTHHMPERLGAVLLINPPGIFDLLLAVVRPIADARTLSKVHSISAPPTRLAAVLTADHGLSHDAATWIAAAHVMDAKTGNLPPLAVPARAMQLVPPATLPPPASPPPPVTAPAAPTSPTSPASPGHFAATGGGSGGVTTPPTPSPPDAHHATL